MSKNGPGEIFTVSSDRTGPFHVHGQRLFILNWSGNNFVVPDYCTHRGGPLSLGTCNKERATLVCPWHAHHNRISSLLEKALPAVRVGQSISFVFTKEQQ
ncbi:Rieske (2Fe-2S) protein [Cystobacter fuscus]|uniref:Rieske (2Fe-2S) protein n=1 Tax=Cystobacter fuscus TaxID=43 RepID=UPI002B2856FA|nr:Rieske (2Fe-2S) protein [Cystobacter fuscus]